jgi:hypothetical protein
MMIYTIQSNMCTKESWQLKEAWIEMDVVHSLLIIYRTRIFLGYWKRTFIFNSRGVSTTFM